jgi:hypothetical protein
MKGTIRRNEVKKKLSKITIDTHTPDGQKKVLAFFSEVDDALDKLIALADQTSRAQLALNDQPLGRPFFTLVDETADKLTDLANALLDAKGRLLGILPSGEIKQEARETTPRPT